jgi:cytochrome c nitrite reductase small subunit
MTGPGATVTVLGLTFSMAMGVAAGVGGFTFVYADGLSYMGNDPATCANCHVMREQHDGWLKSSHRAVATCNDCHTPAGIVAKYVVKAANGYHHSLAFTSGVFHEPIQIKERNRAVTEGQCRHCHADLTSAMEGLHAGGQAMPCLACHRNVGHLH